MARRILGGAIVPATPQLLDGSATHQPAEMADAIEAMRADTFGTLERLPDPDVVVVVDTGPRGIHQHVRTHIDGVVEGDVSTELPVPAKLLAVVTRVTQYPLVATDHLPASASVLAVLLHRTFGPIPTIVATVPGGAEGAILGHVGAALVEAVREVGATGIVIATGDLSTSPQITASDADPGGVSSWDDELVSSLVTSDPLRLYALGPERAKAAEARSWPALAVAQGAFSAARLRPASTRYHAPLGVGELVARYEPAEEREPGERFRPVSPPS